MPKIMTERELEDVAKDLGVEGQEITSAPLVIPEIEEEVPVRRGLFDKMLMDYAAAPKPSLALNTKVMIRPALAIGALAPMDSQIERSAFLQYYG